ncbi:MAG: 4Fe-4S dicluster domain-containing protein [Clostridia bacterium]|nr:4Fe-4S dicluster domain-containing protein [Clostridia bacterium]
MTVNPPGTAAGAGARLVPSPDWAREVERESAQPVSLCYQCQKCSGGCPLAFAMDVLPHRLIRYVQLGQKERVWQSRTVWLCAACRTCAARCPNGIDIAAVADVLKQQAMRRGLVAPEPSVQAFHQTFLSSLRSRGRMHELTMLLRFKLKAGFKGSELSQDLRLGLAMLRHGKLRLLPEGVRRTREIQALFARAQEGKSHGAV